MQEPKIKDATLEVMTDVLLEAIYKVGIRANNIPEKGAFEVLIRHMLTHYGNHTAKEISLAFDMAVMDQLGLKEVNSFENFSCLYFSTVMNAYRLWAHDTYQQYRHLVEIPEEKPISLISWRGEVQNALDLFYKDKLKYKTLPADIYDQIVYDGFLNAFAYEAFLEAAKSYLLHVVQIEIAQVKSKWTDEDADAGKYKSVEGMNNKLVEYRNGNRDSEIRLLAKQMAVKHYFTYLRLQEITTLYQKDDKVTNE